MVWEEIQSGKVFPIESKREDGRGHRSTQFASEVAQVVRTSKRDINAKIARARELGDDIHRIPGTSLDKGVELELSGRRPVDASNNCGECLAFHLNETHEL